MSDQLTLMDLAGISLPHASFILKIGLEIHLCTHIPLYCSLYKNNDHQYYKGGTFY